MVIFATGFQLFFISFIWKFEIKSAEHRKALEQMKLFVSSPQLSIQTDVLIIQLSLLRYRKYIILNKKNWRTDNTITNQET